MPRRNKYRNGRRNGGGSSSFTKLSSAITRIPFRAAYSQTVANSAAYTATENSLLISTLGDRIVFAGDIFTQWRIASLNLKSTIINNVSSPVGLPSTFHGVTFLATDPVAFGKPTSFAQVVDMPCFNYGIHNTTVSLNVPKRLLTPVTPTKWYSTSTSGQFQSAGAIQFFVQHGIASANVSVLQTVVLEGVAEFVGPVDPANVPLEDLCRQVKNSRDRAELRKNTNLHQDEKSDPKSAGNTQERKDVPPNKWLPF